MNTWAAGRSRMARHAVGRDLRRHRGQGGAAAPGDQAEYLGSLGLKETGLARVVHAGYGLLDLVTFFTVGRSAHGPCAARPRTRGRRRDPPTSNFIRAGRSPMTVTLKGESGARRRQLRLEGKEYWCRTATSSTSASTSRVTSSMPVKLSVPSAPSPRRGYSQIAKITSGQLVLITQAVLRDANDKMVGDGAASRRRSSRCSGTGLALKAALTATGRTW